jgi:hypothetical protein
MKISLVGVALGGLVAVGCGHATPTGTARNDWATPVGRATAQNPRYVNPLAAAHPTHNPARYANDYAAATRASDAYTPVAPEPVGAVPPPAQPLPPPETVPDVPPPPTR